MSTVEPLLANASARLKTAGVDSPRAEARLLLAHAMGVRQEEIISESAVPDAASLARFESFIGRRLAHEPFAYIVGRREFWSLPFAVGKGVLVPRPESETHVEQALKRYPDKNAALNVLDLGTGSGCILLAFLSERPNARGTGVDISEDALSYARGNAKELGLDSRARFLASDWTAKVTGTYDIVFANPPYVRREDIAALSYDVAGFEPEVALDGGDDGFDAYRKIVSQLPPLLAPGAHVFVELGAGEAESVAEIFTSAGLDVEGIVNDLAYIPRCLIAVGKAAGQHVKRKKELVNPARSG